MSSPVRRAKLLSEYGIPGVTHPSGEAPRTHNAVFVVPSASTMKKKIKPVKKKKRRTATTPTYVTKAESDAKIHLYQRTATDLRFVNAALAEEVQRSRSDAEKDLSQMRVTLNSVERTLQEEHERALIAKEKLATEVTLHAKAAADYKDKHKDIKKSLKKCEEDKRLLEDELHALQRQAAHLEEKLDSAEARVAVDASERAHREGHLVKLEGSLEMLRNQHEGLVQREKEADDRARELERVRSDLSARLHTAENIIRNLTERNQDLTERAAKADSDRAEAREAATRSAGESHSTIGVLREQLSHVGKELGAQEAATEKAQKEVEVLRRGHAEKNEKLAASAAREKELEAALRSGREAIERLETANERVKRENEAIAMQVKKDLEAAAGGALNPKSRAGKEGPRGGNGGPAAAGGASRRGEGAGHGGRGGLRSQGGGGGGGEAGGGGSTGHAPREER
mmetsp:Transcript_49886/g.159566  ORF Transcript_49886/g.159566 Transcript_49886/m.159566 type:complete len:456 (+) Transcript_49886:669-2036(+)